MNNSASNMTANNSNMPVGNALRTSSYYARSTAPIPTATLEEALALIDASGVVRLLEEWAKGGGRSARPATLTSRQVLAVWISLGLAQKELTVSNATSVLCEHLTPGRRRALDLPDGFSSLVPEQVTRAVERVTRRLTDTIDAYPSYSRGRRLTKREWERLLQDRAERCAELEERRARFAVFANRLLGAQHKTAGFADSDAAVSVVVDSCFRAAGARGISRRRFEALESEGRVSAEPDAGFAVYGATAGEHGQARYGWEDELAVLIPNDPDQPRSVPNIVIGINPHRPHEGFAAAAAEMLQDIAARPAGLDHVVVDRAYMAARPAPFRTSLADLGAKLVADYPATRLGAQRKSDTGVLVDGTWYAPALPARLQTAGQNFAQAFSATTDPKERSEASQELKALVDARADFARLHPHVPAAPSTERNEQHYPYHSEQWSKVNNMGRQAFESYAASLREARKNTRGGVRGATAQGFLSVLTVIGTNARIIEDFHGTRETPRDRTAPLPL
ncbi:hypothetical protein [Microbacterium paraoxydans]|uniref:Uncharacterized protein n=1 Tax=Microbacterium paraoxydans TaxID=199592 RepID=A0A1H1X2W2_9MICO|nr:hypothetical protein [Microbacterium paraoxydans]SDT03658.1 hypothetical protein SAMN04489809_3341 [Microbacterium paraoxydans]